MDTNEDSKINIDEKDEVVVDSTSDDVDIVSEEDDYSPQKIKKLREDLKAALKEKEEYLTLLQRTKADYINSKKEDEKRRVEIISFANEAFVSDLIPALDAFDMAMQNKEAWEKVDKNWRLGVEYIYNKIIGALNDHGVALDNPVGKKFDVMSQNPVGVVETEDESKGGIIAEVTQKGYLMKDKSIRPASVKVFEFKS